MEDYQGEYYIEIAQGSPGNRNHIIPINNLGRFINGEPLFRSYYKFDNQLLSHIEKSNTVKGFSGTYYIDKIIFDIDKSDDDDERTLEKARQFVEDLIVKYQLPDSYVQPWFSGTGYHIIIPDVFGFKPSKDLPSFVRTTLNEYFPEADTIYDGARLIRVAYTKNEKSGRYKIPLTMNEFWKLPYEEIHKLALNPKIRDIELNIEREPKQLLKVIVPDEDNEEINISEKIGNAQSFKSENIITCIQKMWEEGPISGSQHPKGGKFGRHNKLLRMSSYYLIRCGIPIEGVKTMLSGWANNMDPKEVSKIVEWTWQSDKPYGCNNPLMDAYCDKKCYLYSQKMKGKDGLLPVQSANEMEKQYIEAIRKDISDSSFNLKELYPSIQSDYIFKPQELTILLGDTGLGKTAFLQNIAVKIDLPVLWLELEFGSNLMYRRFIQIAKSKTKEEVNSHYKTNDNTWSNSINHIKCLTVAPAIQSIRKLIAENSAKVVIIDTIDAIRTGNHISDSMFKIDYIINELREIVDTMNVMVIGVSHITKQDSRMGILNVHSGKHSSSIAQKADKVIGLEGSKDSVTRAISSLKSRDEGSFRLLCEFNPSTFEYKEMNRVKT